MCSAHTVTQLALRDFRFFFSHKYLPAITNDPDAVMQGQQGFICDYIHRQMEAGAPVRLLILKGRQVGSTEVSAAFLLWYAIRASAMGIRKRIGIFSFREETAFIPYKDKIRPAVLADPWFRSFIASDTPKKDRLLQTEAEFKGGTRILTDTASENAARGGTNDLVLYTEAAFMSDGFFQASEPSNLAGDNHVIYESTPGDMSGTFYENSHIEDYFQVRWPSFTLTEEGTKEMKAGRHHHLLPSHFSGFYGINMTYERIMPLIKARSMQQVRQEFIGEFVAGSELMYPLPLLDRQSDVDASWLMEYGLYDDSMDMVNDLRVMWKEIRHIVGPSRKIAMREKMSAVLGDVDRWKDSNDRGRLHHRDPWRFKIGIDWGYRDMTVCLVIAVRRKDGLHQLVEARGWNRHAYEDSYDIVRDLYRKWKKAGHVTVQPDETAGQEQGSGALKKMGVGPILGMNMNLPNKKNAAAGLFHMLQNDLMRLYPDAPLRNGLASVNWNVKSEQKGPSGGRRYHLDDFAAAMLCAVHTERVGRMVETGTRKKINIADAFLVR